MDEYLQTTLNLYVENYLVTTLACVAFIVFIVCNHNGPRKSSTGFMLSTICMVVVIAAEIVEHYYSLLLQPSFVRVVVSALAYSARPAIAYFVIADPLRKAAGRYAPLFCIPLILNALLAFSALFSPIMFSYDAGNSFTRGPLGFVPFVVAAFYLVVLFWLGIVRIRRGEVVDAIICTTAIVMCSFGVFIEFRWQHVGILPSMAIFCELFYYTYLVMLSYSTDFLTGAFLRNRMYKEVALSRGERYYITFDVNGLKLINDGQGHTAGDEALVSFASAVHANKPISALFYRLGGDEFAVLYRTSSEQDVLDLIERIRKDCTDLPYGFSVGYGKFAGSDDFERVTIEADDMLYDCKRAFWEKHDRREALQ